eukprot:scaffold3291_cov109-Isochrysis_galbana.AAC.3
MAKKALLTSGDMAGLLCPSAAAAKAPRLGHERKHMAHKLTRHIAAAPPAHTHTHTLRSKRVRVSALSAQNEKASNRRYRNSGTEVIAKMAVDDGGRECCGRKKKEAVSHAHDKGNGLDMLSAPVACCLLP